MSLLVDVTIISSVVAALSSGIATWVSILRSSKHRKQKEDIKDLKMRVKELQMEIDNDQLSPDRVSKLIDNISSDLKSIQESSLESSKAQK